MSVGKRIRQPIVSILAHVDHGKTTFLDYIRRSNVVRKEAGGITQHIGASEVPKEVLEKRCKELLQKFNISIEIPGLLFIDTPGHEAFTLLRKRGGALADISILIIDINEGVMPQTKESIEILKEFKTPFVIALNKIDRIEGWITHNDKPFLETFNNQRKEVQENLLNKAYNIIGQLYDLGINADLYYQIEDFTKTVALVPISALTGEGVGDILAIVTGLVQRYLKDRIEIDPKGVGRGVILELKDIKGIGKALDIVLYDGMIRKGDKLLIGNIDKVVESKVKGILKPASLEEIRSTAKFIHQKEVVAAAGIRVIPTHIDEVIPGAQIISFHPESGEDIEKYKNEIREDVESIQLEEDKEGVVIKADALGSLEALIRMAKGKGINIREASIGVVSKRDVILVENMPDEYKVIFAFNVNVDEDAKDQARASNVKIFQSKVIYHILEEYEEFVEKLQEENKKKILESVEYPFKLKFLDEFVFRQSKPAIIGVEVVAGKVRSKTKIMNQEGKRIGEVIAIQKMGENVKVGEEGDQIAISIDKGFVGRNIKEGDVFYPVIPKEHYKILKENEHLLKDNEKNVLEEIREIMKRENKLYDVF